jgi:RHS repeat-associated protein/uncharacterized delta-60 repeat protein
MIQTVTNPDVTTNQSNGSVDTSFGVNSSNTTITALSASPSSAVSAVDGADVVVATIVSGTAELLWYNASGGLDTAYGSGSGIVSLSFTGWTKITSIVVQPNGDIDLAYQTSSAAMNVAQLNADGSIDTSFGSSGVKSIGTLPRAQGMVIADNGELLVVGISGTNFEVTELNQSSGSLDTSYNSSGTASIAVYASGPGTNSLAYAGMAVSPFGDLILAGAYKHGTGISATSGLGLAALTPSGHADSSFGTSGVKLNGGSASVSSTIYLGPIAITSDGQILVAESATVQYVSDPQVEGSVGRALGLSTNTIVVEVTEYNRNGSVDTSFGSSGTASVDVATGTAGPVLNIQFNGQIALGEVGSTGTFNLVRFNADGTLDTTFGSSGIETGASITAGLTMVTAANGETVMIGQATSGGLVLQEFHTLANTQTLYPTYDADYNVTSLTNSSGGVVERYTYDPYGTVTVLNADGTVRGDGTITASFYGWVYTFQGGRVDPVSGLVHFEYRDLNTGLGRWVEQDPDAYINGPDVYQLDLSSPTDYADPTGLIVTKTKKSSGVSATTDNNVTLPVPTPIPKQITQGNYVSGGAGSGNTNSSGGTKASNSGGGNISPPAGTYQSSGTVTVNTQVKRIGNGNKQYPDGYLRNNPYYHNGNTYRNAPVTTNPNPTSQPTTQPN